MHSTELPVTEWWDPAEEVYAVPPCPQGDGRTDANLWTEAFLFSETIGWIWADYDGYWGRWTRQLTTGADVFDVTTHDAEACTICAPLVGPLFTRPPVPPCTCRYGLFYAFRINAWCPHHGYAAADRLVDLVLDEDERRGH